MSNQAKIWEQINKSFKVPYMTHDDVLPCMYSQLGQVEILDTSENIYDIKFKVIPYYGIHADKEYTVTLKFQDAEVWPRIYVDSKIYHSIQTNQYIRNQGFVREHKGICFKYIYTNYSFRKTFREKFNSQWKNYIYQIINEFNNPQNFGGGNGIKSNYKEILGI